jgi:hypothetical protein
LLLGKGQINFWVEKTQAEPEIISKSCLPYCSFSFGGYRS